MAWLLWKDFRLSRSLFAMTLLLVFGPPALAALVAWYWHAAWAPYLTRAAWFSLVASQIPVVILGGVAIAGERGERSAEFLACQPVSRGRILASKLSVIAGFVALGWIPSLSLLAAVSPASLELRFLGSGASLLMLFFGMAWLFSCWLENPTFAIAAGLCAAIVLLFVVMSIVTHLSSVEWFVVYALPWIWLTFGLGGFLLGTRHYLRRVEP